MILFLFSLFTVFTFSSSNVATTQIENRPMPAVAQGFPVLVTPELVTHLPADLPQRVSGFAYDGEKFWFMLYETQGRFTTFNPSTMKWETNDSEPQRRAIGDVTGTFMSAGGACFVDGKLWLSSAYGESFGSIDLQSWKVDHLFKGKFRVDFGQSYSGLAYDGAHLWTTWHWMNYRLPSSQTQLLLKVDPQTGKVVEQYPAPAGSARDITHGLTWDGTRLWHAKDKRLSAIDPSTGMLTKQYFLEQVKRPSGLAWDGTALWIVEFDGNVWRLRL